MSVLPTELLDSLQDAPGFNREAFVRVHASGEQVTSVRMNPLRKGIKLPFRDTRKIPWCENGLYLPERPSFTGDPVFHAGGYYVQEASSMFLEQALLQHLDFTKGLRVLDLCAAPGGKSTHILSLLPPGSFLVANEIIRSRVNILEENIIKWGSSRAVVTSNDPVDFTALGGYFDCIVVDAPCSGSGLFRRDPDAVAEWSPDVVNLCSQRQQRILADILPCLKPGGILVYSTCSYSPQEDEEIADWLVSDMALLSKPIHTEKDWQVIESRSFIHGAYAYRFYPDKLEGEGFFMAVFQKPGEPADEFQSKDKIKDKKAKLVKITEADRKVITDHVSIPDGHSLIGWQDVILLMPDQLLAELPGLQSCLYIRKAGLTLGSVIRGDFIPDHELALSGLASGSIPRIELTEAQALQYLRRSDLAIETTQRGWAILTYHGLGLGWVKILPNRINNYYPKDWRILNK